MVVYSTWKIKITKKHTDWLLSSTDWLSSPSYHCTSFQQSVWKKSPGFFRKIPPSGSSRTSWNLGHDVLGPIKGRIRNGCIREFSNPEKSRFRMRSKHLFPNQKNRVKRIVKQGTSIWWKWTNNDPYHQLISHAKLPTLHVWGPFSPSFNSNN